MVILDSSMNVNVQNISMSDCHYSIEHLVWTKDANFYTSSNQPAKLSLVICSFHKNVN